MPRLGTGLFSFQNFFLFLLKTGPATAGKSDPVLTALVVVAVAPCREVIAKPGFGVPFLFSLSLSPSLSLSSPLPPSLSLSLSHAHTISPLTIFPSPLDLLCPLSFLASTLLFPMTSPQLDTERVNWVHLLLLAFDNVLSFLFFSCDISVVIDSCPKRPCRLAWNSCGR